MVSNPGPTPRLRINVVSGVSKKGGFVRVSPFHRADRCGRVEARIAGCPHLGPAGSPGAGASRAGAPGRLAFPSPPPAHSASLSGPPEPRWGDGRRPRPPRRRDPVPWTRTRPSRQARGRPSPRGRPWGRSSTPTSRTTRCASSGPSHRPRPRRPSRGLFRTRRAGRRAHHLPDAPVSTGPARRRGGPRHH